MEIQDLYGQVYLEHVDLDTPADQNLAARTFEIAEAAAAARQVLESNRLCLIAGSPDAPGLYLPPMSLGGLANYFLTGSFEFAAAPDIYYANRCMEWAADLQAKTQITVDLLVAAGDLDRAEILAANSDTLVNVGETSQEVTGPLPGGTGNWCDANQKLCDLIKLAGWGLAAVVVLNLVQTVRR